MTEDRRTRREQRPGPRSRQERAAMGVCIDKPRAKADQNEADENGTGYYVLTDEQYEKFEQCMTSTAGPTPLMQAAATLHQELLKRKRQST